MKKFLIMILLTLGILTSCETVHYITPDLPEYSIQLPEKPSLRQVDEEIPNEVVLNTLDLMFYAEKLEIIVNGWEQFYQGLREKNNEFSAR